MAIPIHFPHIDWRGDWQWVDYQIFNDARVPPPHTWQDWTATALLIAASAVFFLLIALLCYLWRRDVMGDRERL
jgi:hypothetical protein